MQKKLIALAIASAMAAPAALADVTIYGKMDVSYNFLDHDNTAGNFEDDNQSINSNSSRLGFKGSEDLGGGLKANFLIESAITVDGGGTGLNQRNTWVGLSGDWGEMRIGRHDTPFKIAGRKTDLYESEQLGENRAVFNRTTGAGYDVRAGEAIAYLSPSFSGFQVVAAYVPEEGVDDGDAFSVAGFYGNGPLFLTAAYEQFNEGVFGGTGEQSAWRLGGKYSFGDFLVSGLYQNGDDEGGVSGADHDAWWLGGQYTFGNNALMLTYGENDRDAITKNDELDVWTLGLNHNFSKRTMLYARYASLSNDNGGRWTLDTSGFDNGDGCSDGTQMSGGMETCAAGASPKFGGDSSGLSVGVRHKF